VSHHRHQLAAARAAIDVLVGGGGRRLGELAGDEIEDRLLEQVLHRRVLDTLSCDA
jgi:hypothetical protein